MLHVQNWEIEAYSNVWRCSRDHLHVTSYMYDGKFVNLNVSIINPILTDLVCHDSHCCFVIQHGKTALDRARRGKIYAIDESRYDEVIKYLEEFGK